MAGSMRTSGGSDASDASTARRLAELATPRLDEGDDLAWTARWASRDGRCEPRCSPARHRDFVVLTDRRLLLVLAAASSPAGPRRLRARRAARASSTLDDIGRPRRTAAPCASACAAAGRCGSSSAVDAATAALAARARRRDARRSAPAPAATSHGRRDRDRRRHDRRAHVRGRRARRARARASYREFPQHFPQPGWVEHDADDIWRVTLETLAEVAARARRRGRDRRRDRHHEPARDGRRVGPRAPARPLHRAIVWQDRRTAARCDELRAAGHEPLVRAAHRARARPVLLGDEARVAAARGRRRAPTPTSRSAPSTRGSSGTSPAAPTAACTRPIRRTRAARCSSTSARATWSDELCDAVRRAARVPARRCCRRAGASASTAPDVRGRARGAGERHRRRPAGRAVRAGVRRAGHDEEHLRHRLVRARERRRRRCPSRSTGCSRRSRGRSAGAVTYAMEGAIFVTGAAVQWLRDGLEHHRRRGRDRAARRERCPTPAACTSCPRSPGSARRAGTRTRAARSSASRAARRARTSRAPSSRRWRSRPPTSSTRSPRASGTALAEMRVDGGASVMDLLCQFQADVLGVPVRRAAVQETTALGAAFLAGLAEGVWDSPADRERDVAAPTRRSRPRWTRRRRDARHGRRGAARSSGRATGRDELSAATTRRPRACATSANDRDARDVGRDVLGLLASRTCRRTRSRRAGRSRTSPRR